MRSATFLFLVFSASLVSAQIRYEDRIRIREAKRISQQFGDQIWEDYTEPPFSILFVMDDQEYLIEHYYQPDDFERLAYDTLIQSTVYKRKAQMNKHFLATFPFAGLNTIVIGMPENTGLNSTEWIITLLHERFHQYQYSAPKYFQKVNELNLANGDQTGMWQLNYAFPYKDPLVVNAYNVYINALHSAVMARGTDEWEVKKSNFLATKKKFKERLSADDYKYIAFQWYQEGVARYTEYAFLEKLANYKPTQEVQALGDFIPFAEYKEDFFKRHMESLLNMKLEEAGRLTVYDVGFAEALVLREINPNWQDNYLEWSFDLDELY